MESSMRSVKIGADERSGWSSERPRRAGEPERPPRPVDVSVRCRVLAPSDRLRYTPGSLVLVVSGKPGLPDELLARVLEDKSTLLSMAKVRALLKGRVAPEEIEEKAAQLLDAAIAKRIDAGESVAVPVEGVAAETRDRFVRLAAKQRRPRHLILLEAPKNAVDDEDRALVNELRTALDAGDLGAEGFHTALRLGGGTLSELKRIVFAPPPADD